MTEQGIGGIALDGTAVVPLDDVARGRPRRRLSALEWLRFGPFLAQLVVIRRCNLDCAYCSEFDQTSDPVPFDRLAERLEKLWELRTWAVCLTGGEPTLHPELVSLLEHMRSLGFRRRMMITNGLLLSDRLVSELAAAGLTDLQVSVDGVRPNETTRKTLDVLRPKLERLRGAPFRVVLSGVIGSAPPEEALEVVEFARQSGFHPRILLIHDAQGRLDLTPHERAVYARVKQTIGAPAREAHDYRDRLIAEGRAPFRCRAGARYLYIDEYGRVHWCSQTRGVFQKDLLDYGLDDLKAQFGTHKDCNATCTVGCARTASAWDEWRH